jgi:hypothetical protein
MAALEIGAEHQIYLEAQFLNFTSGASKLILYDPVADDMVAHWICHSCKVLAVHESFHAGQSFEKSSTGNLSQYVE